MGWSGGGKAAEFEGGDGGAEDGEESDEPEVVNNEELNNEIMTNYNDKLLNNAVF